MVQVVYDIQQAQGTQEHTQDPAPFDPTPMIDSAARSLASGIGSLAGAHAGGRGGSGKQTDYSPLVRALNNYKDTVQGREVSSPEQVKLWNSLVEWAGSQGYSYSEIDGYAKTTNASIPNESLTDYTKRVQLSRDAQQKAMQENAIRAYPDVDAEKALELYTNDITEDMLSSSIGQSLQTLDGTAAKNMETMSSGIIERRFSRRIQALKSQMGSSFSSDALMTAVQEEGTSMIQEGWSPNYVSYLQDYMYNLWEDAAATGDKRVKAVTDSLKDQESIAAHDKNMSDIRIKMLMNNEKEAWLRTPMSLDVGTPDNPDIQTYTGARVAMLADINPDFATVLLNKSGTNSQKVFESIIRAGGTPQSELTPTYDRVFLQKEYADLAASSPNKMNRLNAANTQINAHKNWIERTGEAQKIDPRTHSSDLIRILNRNITLDAEDYNNSKERQQVNTDFSKEYLSVYSAVLGNELNNSLPLFNEKGNLRLYKVNKYNPGPYSVEDITEGYSMFGDRNVFTDEYAVGVPMLIDNISKITGMSSKDAKQMYNTIVVSNSDVGKRISAGQDTRGRFISTESPLNSSAPLSDTRAQEILDKITQSTGGRLAEFTLDDDTPIDTRNTKDSDWLVKPVSKTIELPAQAHGFVGTEALPSRESFVADTENRLNSGELKKEDLRGQSVEEYSKDLYNEAVAEQILIAQGIDLNRVKYITPASILSSAQNEAEQSKRDITDVLEEWLYNIKEEQRAEKALDRHNEFSRTNPAP